MINIYVLNQDVLAEKHYKELVKELKKKGHQYVVSSYYDILFSIHHLAKYVKIARKEELL